MKGCSDRVMQALWGSQGGPIKVAVYVALVDLLCLLNLGLNTPLFRQPTSADTLAIVFLAIFVSSSILLLAKVLRPKLWTIPGLWAVIFAAALVSHQELNIYLVRTSSDIPNNPDCRKVGTLSRFYTNSHQILQSVGSAALLGKLQISNISRISMLGRASVYLPWRWAISNDGVKDIDFLGDSAVLCILLISLMTLCTEAPTCCNCAGATPSVGGETPPSQNLQQLKHTTDSLKRADLLHKKHSDVLSQQKYQDFPKGSLKDDPNSKNVPVTNSSTLPIVQKKSDSLTELKIPSQNHSGKQSQISVADEERGLKEHAKPGVMGEKPGMTNLAHKKNVVLPLGSASVSGPFGENTSVARLINQAEPPSRVHSALQTPGRHGGEDKFSQIYHGLDDALAIKTVGSPRVQTELECAMEFTSDSKYASLFRCYVTNKQLREVYEEVKAKLETHRDILILPETEKKDGQFHMVKKTEDAKQSGPGSSKLKFQSYDKTTNKVILHSSHKTLNELLEELQKELAKENSSQFKDLFVNQKFVPLKKSKTFMRKTPSQLLDL